MSSNPLIKAYRKPSVYVSLPSGGKFYNPAPNLSVDGELAIYPMTARDELITKTPDALFNGEATIALIESCCPDIPNPRQIPSNDLVVILLGIRQATYGQNIDLDIKCPNCNEFNLMTVDSNAILASVKENKHSNILKLDNDFALELKPFNLEDRTLLQIQQIKQQKLIEGIAAADMSDEDRNKRLGQTFVEIAELTVRLISNCIISVETPDKEKVNDRDLINDWLESISKSDYDKIRGRIEELSETGLDTKFRATCQACGHGWESYVELDMANFFGG